MPSLARPRSYGLFAGIDVSAATVTVSWMVLSGRPTGSVTIPQTADGCHQLQTHLLATGVAAPTMLIVLEATGSYWMTLATTLVQAQFAVAVINPAQAHGFAKALLKRAKTDVLDAHMLAHLGARLRLEPGTPPPDVYVELQQRLMQREALIQIRTQVRNQRHALLRQPRVIAEVQQRMDRLLDTLNEHIAEADDDGCWHADRRLSPRHHAQLHSEAALCSSHQRLTAVLVSSLCRSSWSVRWPVMPSDRLLSDAMPAIPGRTTV